MSTRLSTDLENPIWIKLLKLEASETNTSMKEVLIKALESYFAHKIETKMLQKTSEDIFTEWHDEKDSAYDNL